MRRRNWKVVVTSVLLGSALWGSTFTVNAADYKVVGTSAAPTVINVRKQDKVTEYNGVVTAVTFDQPLAEGSEVYPYMNVKVPEYDVDVNYEPAYPLTQSGGNRYITATWENDNTERNYTVEQVKIYDKAGALAQAIDLTEEQKLAFSFLKDNSIVITKKGTVKAAAGGGGCAHTYAWDYDAADENSDTHAYYRCTQCGDTQGSYVIPNSAYTTWNKNVAKKIEEASNNGTVKIVTNQWTAFHQLVADALAKRPDVTLQVTYTAIGGKDNGQLKKFVIPAGTDVQDRFADHYCGFMNLADFEVPYVYGQK